MALPSGTSIYDLDAFLRGLDAIFDAHQGATHADPYLLSSLVEAERLHDEGAQLSILNELMGFYRSQSRHDDATATGSRALTLADQMGIKGTDAHATTLINAATALRAASRYDDALDLYRQALATSEAAMSPTDRRLAALHNNLSILFSEMGDQPQAAAELAAALAILEASSGDPTRDVEIATTCTNLALVCFSLGRDADAAEHVERSLAIYQQGGHENDAHYASALAGHAEACFRMGRTGDAVVMYRAALGIIAECYGTDNDYYAVTAANLAEAEDAAQSTPDTPPRAVGRTRVPRDSDDAARPAGPPIKGLTLAREYWETHGRPMLEKYPHHRGRIAVGLVGHGSECYGFDDEASRDHDFGPGFCLWLTPGDHAEIGAELQADYDALPREFRGVRARVETTRARGAGRRVGVFEIGDFYEQITGYREAPAADRVHEWLLLEEATLAAATNGMVFVDPFGAFGAVRGGFLRMPRDVVLALVSRRLGMIAQAGQYNVPRMLARGDGEAVWLAVSEFTRAVASVVFLLNGPASAGYLPYYKWQFAALRKLSGRMASRLPGVSGDLSEVLCLASAACFGRAAPARARLEELIEQICRQIVVELQARGLSQSDETFLERQRPFVEAHIDDEWLKSL
ncbi:Tetratricopeptide (TPR) repeat [Sanguibacter gelidistatuariae]|uniref:Tetratricopeptide (TPR) repeat n=1 Tax=Sanguibacter gelidistatuariae TaxID=1814289 RepID=A0A1G6XLD0_9MICO|nr:DUF4037 domain-containing protein [Sanguibacter gelidistatuariae]SDD79044.1 Tetratricopeptide (TPR) repeat [Sanguibacter gelidistatuariae]